MADKARNAIETGAAAASRYIEAAGDNLEQRYSGAENPRQLDPKTKARYSKSPAQFVDTGASADVLAMQKGQSQAVVHAGLSAWTRWVDY